MQKHTFYKITTYILLPVAALFALFILMLLFIALANPPMLLPLFVVACVVIYVFTSFKFLNKGIIRNNECKPGLKDWIKVNGYVSIVFATLMLIQTIAAVQQPELMSKALDETMAMQPANQQISKAMLMKMVTGIMYFFGVISILLLVHIFSTFRLLKQYRHLFGYSSNDPQ